MSEVYAISQQFDSIQGEGFWIGTPTSFIRFSGCNLRCAWCDTQYAWEAGQPTALADIVAQVRYRHIVLTGGEPSLQNLPPLLQALRSACPQSRIAIETNGTTPLPPGIDWVTCSPKPRAQYCIRCTPDELKYVVDDSFEIAVIPPSYHYRIPIWLQPNAQDLPRSMTRCWTLAMAHPFLRVGVQLHKVYNIP